MTITPIERGERVEYDMISPKPLPRGRSWRRWVAVRLGGVGITRRLLLKGRSCGLSGCFCDTEVIDEKEG